MSTAAFFITTIVHGNKLNVHKTAERINCEAFMHTGLLYTNKIKDI